MSQSEQAALSMQLTCYLSLLTSLSLQQAVASHAYPASKDVTYLVQRVWLKAK